jgi:hypothetical protein
VFQPNKKQGVLCFLFVFLLFFFLCLIILGSDVIDDRHGVANEKLDGTVIGVEGVKLVRLFDEKLIQDV